MVLINGVKYACERCIRGHRVTTCNHTDQPLMMIKPKGRPSTTCAYCKELRKNKSAKPPGTCTCGRQEKKRQAQKAKEEAKAKAKELAAQSCTCGSLIPCKVHAKRQQRKNTSHHSSTLLSQRKVKSKSRIDRVSSSASLDSHLFSSNQSNISDSSNYFPSTFLDSDTATGKISKEYHHVPSLASISSLQSSQSLDQNFSPTSPQMSSMQFSFLTENPATYTKYGQHTSKAKAHNWDSNRVSIPNRSDSHLNLLENTLTSGLDPLNNTRKIQSPNKSNIGEVIVPLEEYIPPNINGIGKVDDIQSWTEDPSMTNEDDDSNSMNLPEIRPTSFNKVNLHSDKMSNPLTTGNGLLDMFSDSSSISTLSRANLLLQERNDQNNRITSNGRNSVSTWNGVLKDKPFTSNHVPQMKSDYQKSINDSESVASVEVLSLMPSFMDIPENENDTRRFRKLRPAVNPGFSRQRSNSIDRNHKYFKNTHTTTVNPTIVSNNIDDGASLNSFNQSEVNFSHPTTFLMDSNSNALDPSKSGSLQVTRNPESMTALNLINNEPVVDNAPNLNNNEISTIMSHQTSSPTELLSDQGFAELDNFLSTL